MKEKILSVIEKNSRISIEDLAVLLGEPVEAVAQAVMEMEHDKVICGYHTIINWDKVETQKVNALIEVRVTPQRNLGFDKIAERIYNFPEVESIYLMSGGFDFVIFLEGKTLQEVAEFVSSKLSTLESVLSTATHFVLKKYKDHGTIIAEQPKKERMLITP
ncbi:MAG: Lrp/AsnC family transcriptional regulator [Clostridiales bacterium]|nr:Lrp/AsnC family transcriptional regulator [Clostridiales bacterium]MDY3746490.1 Lrp/AsnC family transcriptional regulator [Lachnospiraceae bacterium]